MTAPPAGLSRRRYWTWVALYVVVLLSIQSAMGYGIDLFKELWGEVALSVVAYIIAALGAAGAVWIGWRAWARCTVGERIWIVVALLAYGAGTLTARYPQERLHYLGYGLLAGLLYVGFARDRMPLAWAAALLTGWAIGYADELLQILWPRRYFDWADVTMNVVAVALGLSLAIPLWRATERGRQDAR
ncbi:MAG: VanZ family protein [Acidobacteriota bacterium]|jgi:hypothetical protein